MADDDHILAIAAADREAFALCLALGTLEAIRSGAWSAEAGIWTIARPAFVLPLQDAGIPDVVLDVFRRADELSTIETLCGSEAVKQKLTESVAVLQARIASLPERSWHARWLGTRTTQ